MTEKGVLSIPPLMQRLKGSYESVRTRCSARRWRWQLFNKEKLRFSNSYSHKEADPKKPKNPGVGRYFRKQLVPSLAPYSRHSPPSEVQLWAEDAGVWLPRHPSPAINLSFCMGGLRR